MVWSPECCEIPCPMAVMSSMNVFPLIDGLNEHRRQLEAKDDAVLLGQVGQLFEDAT